jgi:Flp pilus assembly protein TadD
MKIVHAVLVATAALPAGCAGLPPARWTVPADEIVVDHPADPAAVPLVEDGAVLRVSPEMQAFLDRHVAPGASRQSRLRQLGQAILDDRSLGLRYDESTRTAAEAFRARRGNCLSFSTMFVALARRAGLPAFYQEVDTPPDWTLRGDVLVLNRHVNVLVDLGRAGQQVVDFSPDGGARYDRRRITDRRALAHHDNNMAVERLQARDEGTALRYLRRAVGRDASFAPAWTNLGILHLREGRPAHAEAAYLRALQADPGHLVAMSNLATLYEQTGDGERADAYRRRVARHRDGNPYYRYQLAREAVAAGDYDTAIRHLRYAVARRPREERFHALLGVSYQGKGDEKAARTWFARAERISAADSARRPLAPKLGSLVPSRRER